MDYHRSQLLLETGLVSCRLTNLIMQIHFMSISLINNISSVVVMLSLLFSIITRHGVLPDTMLLQY